MYLYIGLIFVIIFQQIRYSKLYSKMSLEYDTLLKRYNYEKVRCEKLVEMNKTYKTKVINLEHTIIVQKTELENERGHAERLRESIRIERENYKKNNEKEDEKEDEKENRKRKCKPTSFGDDGLDVDDLKKDPNY
jgi:hypothetical protein